ncbi:uncharacterized protein [Nicotiana sylvestris]|uniref:uncharacterized protein n=1 Tax=Nicotiana sylvestris TaxID=4096 RepID=UPI00388CA0B2
MLRKDVAIRWTEECQKAFDKIKEYLSKPPVLVPPELGRPLMLKLSVSDGDFGCVLGQHDETRSKLAKWKIFLSGLDIVYVTQKAVKGQALADHLVENSVDGEYEPLKMYFPDEEVLFVGEDITEVYDSWRMFFDTVANFKEVGIGVVLVSETGQYYPLLGEWDTKNTKILPYLHCVQELIKRFTKIEFKHFPGIQNEFANALATLSSMIQHPDKNFIDPIQIGIHKQPTYYAHVEEEIGRICGSTTSRNT